MSLSWSPNGGEVLVTARERENPSQPYGFYSVNAGSGEERLLFQASDAQSHPTAIWVDAHTIVYRENEDIFQRNLDSAESKLVYENSTKNMSAPLAVSPDGKRLAFTLQSLEPPGDRLAIISLRTGELVRGPELDRFDFITSLAWSPDGEHLFYTLRREKPPHQLRRIAADGSNPTKTMDLELPIRGLSIHPSGKKIAFSTQDSSEEVWVLENFLPDL
jgi:Tol biopolymer transport system component